MIIWSEEHERKMNESRAICELINNQEAKVTFPDRLGKQKKKPVFSLLFLSLSS